MSHSALAAGLRHLRGKLAAQQHNDDSDEQLLHAFLANRDDSAFSALVRRHGPMVLRLCRRVLGHEQDAEDAFQATFLVLARQAARLRKKASLASWLHGIAYRIAQKAKRAAARRSKHEGQAPARPNIEPSAALLWDEVRVLLDEEIARLPEKYRSVFVLFHLEDCSREEIARRLGLKEGTVASRLHEARKRLQRRLTRRGVEPTAVLTASTLATQAAPALPPLVMAATIRAALSEGTEGLVSAHVASLAKSATSALLVSKVKLAAVALLAVGLLGLATSGSLVFLYGRTSGPLAATPELPTAKSANELPAAPGSLKQETAKTIEIQGRVLGPDGKPKAGAKILFLGPLAPGEQQELFLESGKVRQLGVSAPDGRFTIAVPKVKKWQHYLIAQCEDAGLDFFDTDDLKPGKPIEFRLVKDHAIRGRIINTEGKPVAGVHVAVNHLGIYPNNSLDSFLVFWKNRPFNFGTRGGKNIDSGAGALLAATSGADGRFALHGVGAERLVSLRLSGGGIAADEVWVVNRAGFDPKPYNQATLDNTPKGERGFNGRWMLSGPDVSAVVEPEKIIGGVVTEADTGKGRPNVLVQLTRKNGDDHTGGDYLSLKVQAKTDAAGRYEIHGARKAKSYLVEVGSDPAAAYLGRGVWAEDTPGYRPATADIRVRKGVIVTGKMIDKATGKPIDGFVVTTDLSGNPFVKEYSFDSMHTNLLWAMDFQGTDANGVFRAVTIPGPVLLMGVPHGNKAQYTSSKPDPKYPQYFEKDGRTLRYRGSGTTIVWGSFCKVLQIKPGVAVVKQDILLERRKVLGVVKIQDADGQPLSDVHSWRADNWIEGDCCTIYGDAADPPRFLGFYQAERKLAGTLNLKAGEKLPPVVKLKPMGSVKGRLLDANGKPLEGVVVAPRYKESAANGINGFIHEDRPIASDANGVFTLDSLIAELPFELSFRRGRREFAREPKPTKAAIQVKPSECRDVGVIELIPDPISK